MKKVQWFSAFMALAVCFAMSTYSQGLIGHWEFEEGSGETVSDSSGNGNDGTIINPDQGLGENGSVWVTDADMGSVVSFAGGAGGAHISLGVLVPAMTLEQDFTWAFYAMQTQVVDPNHIIVGNRYNTEGVDFAPRQFIKFTPTKFEWHMNGNGNDNLEYEDIPNDVWLHHAVVKNGATLTYYRNGAQHSQREITQGLAEPQPLFLGGDSTGNAGEMWIGYMDDVRIYDGALGAGDIYALASRTSYAGDWSLFLK